MRTVYIATFTLFGFLFQLLLHGLLEIWYLNLLLSDFERYGFGLSWMQWGVIHDMLTFIFLIGGCYFGWRQGKYWWRRIYEPISWFRPLQKLNYTR